jgi:putative redox protein
MNDPVVTVRVGTEPYTTRVTARQHTLTADEPGALGGRDAGPSPYELLLAAVGSCKAITVRMYADRKGWPLDAVHVTVSHHRPEGRNGPELLRASLRFEGELTDEQRRRLLEIAEKCPVQRTVTGELRSEAVLEA